MSSALPRSKRYVRSFTSRWVHPTFKGETVQFETPADADVLEVFVATQGIGGEYRIGMIASSGHDMLKPTLNVPMIMQQVLVVSAEHPSFPAGAAYWGRITTMFDVFYIFLLEPTRIHE